MAAVVDVCVGELAKLREKVRARNLFLIKAQKKDAADEQVEESKLAKQQSTSSPSLKSTAHITEETILSEATVCLLMDRFVPW